MEGQGPPCLLLLYPVPSYTNARHSSSSLFCRRNDGEKKEPKLVPHQKEKVLKEEWR